MRTSGAMGKMHTGHWADVLTRLGWTYVRRDTPVTAGGALTPKTVELYSTCVQSHRLAWLARPMVMACHGRVEGWMARLAPLHAGLAQHGASKQAFCNTKASGPC